MPLVITYSLRVFYIPNKDLLQEILWHTDFDGEPWAIGDRIVFEDGTESQIVPEEESHTWGETTIANLDEINQTTGVKTATSWGEIFAHYKSR